MSKRKKTAALLPHLVDQVRKKELVAHFFVHRSVMPKRGPGRHRFMMSCLLINMETPGDRPPFIVSRGIALCHRKDQWNAEIGKEFALLRALRAFRQHCISAAGRIKSMDLLEAVCEYGIMTVKDKKGQIWVKLAEGCGFGPIKPRGPEQQFMRELKKPVKED